MQYCQVSILNETETDSLFFHVFFVSKDNLYTFFVKNVGQIWPAIKSYALKCIN